MLFGKFFVVACFMCVYVTANENADCSTDVFSYSPNRWTMPLLKVGEKHFYFGIFFKLNWYKSAQYCRYHGMDLASISSQEENDALLKHIDLIGFKKAGFWLSGTDLGQEGSFYWMSNGRPLMFTDWLPGQPSNMLNPRGEGEDCLGLWNPDGKGLKWNDAHCLLDDYFICEVQ